MLKRLAQVIDKHLIYLSKWRIMYLNLLVGCDGTEDNLREALSGKHPKTDASDDAAVFDKG